MCAKELNSIAICYTSNIICLKGNNRKLVVLLQLLKASFLKHIILFMSHDYLHSYSLSTTQTTMSYKQVSSSRNNSHSCHDARLQ